MLARVRLPMDAVVACQAPMTWIVSLTTSTARAICITAAQARVRASAITAIARAAAPMSHGHGDCPGTQSALPVTLAARPWNRSGIFQSRMTTCVLPGSRRTSAGSSVAIQWVRWSCQLAADELDTLLHSGVAFASYWSCGGSLVGTRVRLRNTAGDRVFSQVPWGPIRR